MPDKEMTMESKLVAPPRVPFLPRRPTVFFTHPLPHPLFFRSPTVTTPKRRSSSIARRSTAAPVTTTLSPIIVTSTTISPSRTTHRRTTPHSIPTTLIPPTTTIPPITTLSTPRSGMTIRSFEKITVEKGRTRRTRVRAEVLLKGKVVEEIRFKRDGEVDFDRRKRDIARRAIFSPSVQHFVSKDRSTVVTTSNSETDDILVIMQDTAPGTTSVFSNADRKIKKAYEEGLNGVEEIFDEIGSSLVRDLPHAGEAFEAAKKDLNKKMNGFKVEGAKTRNIAVRKAIELAATTDDGTANAMKESMKEYFVYDNSFVMMDGLLYSMPVVYSIVQSTTTPIQNSVNQMHGAVENYVTESLSGLREKMPPLTKTTEEIEKAMKKLLNDLTEKTNKKISGMISYETLDAINDMNPTDTQSVSVIQTGPGFSYVTLSSSAPSFSKSLNGTEERAKNAVDEYRKELEPYINGKMLSPEIFGNVPSHTEKTKSLNELLDKLSHKVDDFLHKDHPKSSVEAAKAIQSKPEEKEKLNEAMENATMYSYVPMLYNGWYTLAPVAFTQASDLATATSNQLNSFKGQAVNYAYSLLMDIFGQYQLALVPIEQAVSNMTETGSNIDSKLHETLPFAIAQATTEMPKDKKTALQQIVYSYVPTYPFFG
ncbi:hypothetical protein PRIPAC_78910 [Pristionchus pacificus]|uniref:Uncharacterized protein n=1 Tax=Pristionchus pacificus TaxID=54126 RepID=A0A2A6CBV1_PRIPA|nr:hypothetical protein PRIPAC_78910 [Pristionchus pacificus]|eukprot:PDM75654.1 hypothetical protein PRIPAC_42831 [Pristionchus pacificus]